MIRVVRVRKGVTVRFVLFCFHTSLLIFNIVNINYISTASSKPI